MYQNRTVIEIRKAGFLNKGAELMLYAALDRLSNEFPNAIFAMAPTRENGVAPYSKRAPLGLFQKAELWKKGLNFGLFANLIPAKLREMYGIILDNEVDIAIDASGFSYSDQWGSGSSKQLSAFARRWKRKGTKVVLLPQAFGPFEKADVRTNIQDALKNVDLVFARERISYDHLTELEVNSASIFEAPDFTNLIKGEESALSQRLKGQVCIVPNYRMVDKTNSEASQAYIPFLTKAVQLLQTKGERVFFLVHEGKNDRYLAEQINASLDQEIEIVEETHPLRIKGILGSCKATIGSRFHGLVSALSQGVPSLATGWSHKYKMLFEDYGFPEGLLDVISTDTEMEKKIDLIVGAQSSENLRATISARSDILKERSESMWSQVMSLLRA